MYIILNGKGSSNWLLSTWVESCFRSFKQAMFVSKKNNIFIFVSKCFSCVVCVCVCMCVCLCFIVSLHLVDYQIAGSTIPLAHHILQDYFTSPRESCHICHTPYKAHTPLITFGSLQLPSSNTCTENKPEHANNLS